MAAAPREEYLAKIGKVKMVSYSGFVVFSLVWKGEEREYAHVLLAL